MIAYHGCDAETAERLLRGEPFKKSQNDYDWLGEGIYFWEYGADRALQFAHDQQRRGKVKAPAIVGAILQLGRCFLLVRYRALRLRRGTRSLRGERHSVPEPHPGRR